MNSASKILVVCHDAGGAEIVSCFVAAQIDPDNFICLIAGPAIPIFKHHGVKVIPIQENQSGEHILDAYPNVKYVLTGSSWSTALELGVISAAKKRNIPTSLFLDHWVNYRERFGFPKPGWEAHLPDELIMGDSYAFEIAKNFFPDKNIRLEPNHYFDYIKERAKVMQDFYSEEAGTILWISEPFSQPINVFGDKAENSVTEYDILSGLLEIINKDNRFLKFKIRLHPSESGEKYRKLMKQKASGLSCTLSTETELLVDIFEANYIIGIESMALVVAMLAGKPVASFVPDVEYICPLPFSGIKKINSEHDLSLFLA
ncbi:MAG: hypothetical protein A2821_03165 [Candidatus Magasanikbacteria bacterium RIFCSPHIGHO2_01_FULL_41_23]|uniref:Uncharacterized protein n=1 Tax=Candidatus Magasanikbacteria bacterium RIFCSPLOWO2_01_FULL_40_15 TaxID=1798686 RepID=A0A1F6N3J8_9BACT|nr:MAG: hypothetical protein A2821_03165 [Candidatus Magasanikbacteria bacterium RIFCSPHIGHO2_01_FULL_41_23]OGH67338.1 MAG: hypothetical protein A3C66_01180 [Candidatus Magasanikbacteria bacterium RIFCSPHIGHO2_02_FULL_41_35]OGH76563.1 MAG: hypothetical protein A3F22_00390 [Candidatus Magasanikbacteria bacterium RIFCSPHIGHO2_12_FULL_41_16]OGH78452.1 MAG: hypothetical protein A2983_02965 [Candidatus Magasanikbacteria bacterium RIFCSPLOWO2_01_FULL_40_15]